MSATGGFRFGCGMIAGVIVAIALIIGGCLGLCGLGMFGAADAARRAKELAPKDAEQRDAAARENAAERSDDGPAGPSEPRPGEADRQAPTEEPDGADPTPPADAPPGEPTPDDSTRPRDQVRRDIRPDPIDRPDPTRAGRTADR